MAEQVQATATQGTESSPIPKASLDGPRCHGWREAIYPTAYPMAHLTMDAGLVPKPDGGTTGQEPIRAPPFPKPPPRPAANHDRQAWNACVRAACTTIGDTEAEF